MGWWVSYIFKDHIMSHEFTIESGKFAVNYPLQGGLWAYPVSNRMTGWLSNTQYFMGWDKGYFFMHHLNVPWISSDSLQANAMSKRKREISRGTFGPFTGRTTRPSMISKTCQRLNHRISESTPKLIHVASISAEATVSSNIVLEFAEFEGMTSGSSKISTLHLFFFYRYLQCLFGKLWFDAVVSSNLHNSAAEERLSQCLAAKFADAVLTFVSTLEDFQSDQTR